MCGIVDIVDNDLPPAYPIAAKTGRIRAIIRFPKTAPDPGQLRPVPDFLDSLEVQISDALNAVVIDAAGNGPAVTEHRQG